MGKFGEKLKEMRTNEGLSVRGFAAELEKSPGYISRIEGRGEIPSSDFVMNVAEFFDEELDSLLELVKEDQLSKVEDEINQKHQQTINLFRKGRRR